ncbi:MAG: S8 family serine peptidase [Hyphomonadaceae bacterium]|nr:S8 family serine peptidase [Hyphomonadaceae bacterium]
MMGKKRAWRTVWKGAAGALLLFWLLPGAAAASSGSDDDDLVVEEPDLSPDDEIDNSGPGSGDDLDLADDGADVDNSGPGSDDDVGATDDNFESDDSGPGSGEDQIESDDADAEDNSGSGGGGDDSSADGGGDNSASDDDTRTDLSAAYLAALEDVTFERDMYGDERLAGEVLFASNEQTLGLATNAGYRLIAETRLELLDRTVAILRIPNGQSVDAAIERLSALAPGAIVTANNVYRNAQASRAVALATPPEPISPGAPVLGMIDTGVDARALGPGVVVGQRAFAQAAPAAGAHGTNVAALAAAQGVRIVVADVFRTGADGAPYASSESMAAAIDWLVTRGVAVINVSIEGPNNALLGAVVREASARGHVIVAAAGNGGPLAPPRFPAAFEGSVAITAIDEANRPYVRANRGNYIAFAAPGVNVSIPARDRSDRVSGTSFAAPLVAAWLAQHLSEPSAPDATRALELLRAQSVDLGAPGRDPIYGWGALLE